MVGPLLLVACSFGSSTSKSGGGGLSGTYTGVLQRTGANHAGANEYVSIDATVSVSESVDILGVSEVSFSSSAFPSFSAIVLSTGSGAVNLNPTGIPGSSSFQVEEVAFVKDSEGNWVLVIQTGGTVDGSQATVVQFASYDPSVTPPPTASAAVSYLDEMFALAGK